MLAVSSGPTIRATLLTYYLSIPNRDLETRLRQQPCRCHITY